MTSPKMADLHDAIHGWFGLTYSNYLVLPRSLLQSMPDEWQTKFVELLEEAQDHFGPDADDNYTVQLRDQKGRFVEDPLADYQRGRRFILGKYKEPEGTDHPYCPTPHDPGGNCACGLPNEAHDPPIV